jgi:DNA-binding response OmpR family regulator
MATILLVDDDRLIVELLQRVLGKKGHTILTALKAGEGLRLFREHRPHLTVLDLHMPDIPGVELLARIRELDPKASVMALTGHSSDEEHKEALRLGVSAVLRKSAGIDLIEEVLLSRLEAKGQILVVDDEPMLCNMLARRLTMQDFDVRIAHSGAEALASIEKSRPRLMLLDMYMPEMSGIEVIRTLRKRGDALPIIVLSASRDQSLLDECLRLGSFDVMSKPVDLDYLDMAVLVSTTVN